MELKIPWGVIAVLGFDMERYLDALPAGTHKTWLGSGLTLGTATTRLAHQLLGMSTMPTMIGMTLENEKSKAPLIRWASRLGLCISTGDTWADLERAHNLMVLRPDWATSLWLPYTGSWDPDAVLVGDMLSPRANVPIPFHMDTGSSVYLSQAIAGADLTGRVGFTNCGDLDRLPKHIRQGPLVALGRRAEIFIYSRDRRNVPEVPHPASAARFDYANLDDYAQRIRLAVELARQQDGIRGVQGGAIL